MRKIHARFTAPNDATFDANDFEGMPLDEGIHANDLVFGRIS
jgi:hypothetical protein